MRRFAGNVNQWLTEAVYIAVAQELGRFDEFVLVAVKEVNIPKPTGVGTILAFYARVKAYGNRSIIMEIEARHMLTEDVHFCGDFVFVSTEE